MTQPAIPRLSELDTAGRAELLSNWTATLGKPQLLCGPVASCWPAHWPGNSRSANLVALQPPPNASCGSWPAPTSGRSARLNCRGHRPIFAPAL
jgi:hypothetical protein